MAKETTGPQVNGKAAAPPEPPKAKRGRPPGSKNKEGAPLNETPLGEDAPKRGRPRKMRVEFDREALAKQIRGTHFLAASMTGIVELVIDERESVEIAAALADFAHEFDFSPDPKIMAVFNLLSVAGLIYVPRAIHFAQRVRREKAKQGVTVDGTAQPVETPADGQTSAVN